VLRGREHYSLKSEDLAPRGQNRRDRAVLEADDLSNRVGGESHAISHFPTRQFFTDPSGLHCADVRGQYSWDLSMQDQSCELAQMAEPSPRETLPAETIRGRLGVGPIDTCELRDRVAKCMGNGCKKPECRSLPPTSIWSAKSDGSSAYLGGRERHFGEAASGSNGAPWIDVIHPDDLARTKARWCAALQTGFPFRDVHRGSERTGRYDRFLVDGVPIRNDEGSIICWIGARTRLDDPEADALRDPQKRGDVESAPTVCEQTLIKPPRRLKSANVGSTASPSAAELPLAAAEPSAIENKPNARKNILEFVRTAADAALSNCPERLNPFLLRGSQFKSLLGDLAGIGSISDEVTCLYSHSICVAALARIAGSQLIVRARAQRRQVAVLPKWRLARVIQYVGAHMEEPIKLADLAKAVGITRMHFAAQFRATVGMSPHEYLLRRRIRRAQTLLIDPKRRLADVALSVGFQGQPHFTTVFRRYVGESPHHWRQLVASSLDRDNLRGETNDGAFAGSDARGCADRNDR
jgi:AraC-like DNA-binding protein